MNTSAFMPRPHNQIHRKWTAVLINVGNIIYTNVIQLFIYVKLVFAKLFNIHQFACYQSIEYLNSSYKDLKLREGNIQPQRWQLI